ncbi:MAG TPA: response regulator [Candidatus Moranbacteria bacterium]|nr:response regulator [Candidatus Moranbacteria bacterium]
MDPEKQKILLADEDENLQEIYSKALIDEGFEVLHATDGEDALEKIKENYENLDLVLLDVVMPKMDGFDVLEKIRGAWGGYKKIPIVMLTSLSDPEDIQMAKELGADRFFVKPENNPSDLVREIEKFLDEIHQSPERNYSVLYHAPSKK